MTSHPHVPILSVSFARMSVHDIKNRGAGTMALLPAEPCLILMFYKTLN